MKTCVFIVKQMSQPRTIKRIKSVIDAGIPVKVYGFDNGLYTSNIDKMPFKAEKIYPEPTGGKLSRTLYRPRILKKIKKENPNCVFYIFDYRPALEALILGFKNVIYEESDVDAVKRKNKLRRAIALRLDKLIIRHSIFSVFTSQGFIDFLSNGKGINNSVLLPNKLSPYFHTVQRPVFKNLNVDTKHIRFGFIGLIRYPNTIIRFAKIIGEFFPQHEFLFFGDVERTDMIPSTFSNYSNVHFYGSFTNPQDLEKIYPQIDINIVCYDTASINVRIAEPNKLYESIFFNKPIVVSSGTFLEKRVKELNVGWSINASSDNEIKVFVDKIPSLIKENVLSFNSYTPEDLIDSPKELISSLQDVL